MRNLTHQTKRQKRTRARQKNKNKKMDIFSAITREKKHYFAQKGCNSNSIGNDNARFCRQNYRRRETTAYAMKLKTALKREKKT